MIDHGRYHLAARARLRSFVAAETVDAIASAGSQFTRTAGSFLADGFAPGMEVLAAGFPGAAQNGLAIVTRVETLTLTVDRALGTASASASHSVTAGVPDFFLMENAEEATRSPSPGRPWMAESYLPGSPSAQRTFGTGGQVEVLPSYVARVYVPENSGALAARRYTDAVIRHFPPGLPLALASGEFGWVRWDQGPFPSPLTYAMPGFAGVTVTIPLRIRTPNSI